MISNAWYCWRPAERWGAVVGHVGRYVVIGHLGLSTKAVANVGPLGVAGNETLRSYYMNIESISRTFSLRYCPLKICTFGIRMKEDEQLLRHQSQL